MNEAKVRRALLSVTDKTGLEEFAKGLHALGIELIASGGTAKRIKETGVPVTPVEDVTKFPEMLGGRVKTLHPAIHAGILADRGKKGHLDKIEEHGIKPIGLVVCNLYRFSETISKQNVSLDEAIENIDIGGPTLIRAAAKNHSGVAVVTSPSQYKAVLAELEKNGSLSQDTRARLAAKAFELTASYDSAIFGYLHKKFLSGEIFPEKFSHSFEKLQELRYGENWHQKAALYKKPGSSTGLVNAEQLNGKEMSFNNFNDAQAAVSLVQEFNEPAVVIIKHANPCGTAVSKDLSSAFKSALECDPVSAFGSAIALNRECGLDTAKQIVSFFNEVLIAPSFSKGALAELKAKKNLRVLKMPELGNGKVEDGFDLKPVSGGILLQTPDDLLLNEAGLKVVSKKKPSDVEMRDLRFAWAVAKYAKSNAIVLAKNNATVGVGAGQMSRIDSTEIAVKKSGGRCRGAVLASDSFFPFRDNVDLAANAGITAIIQPGGSIKDDEVIKAANEHKIAMVFTGVRHFRH